MKPLEHLLDPDFADFDDIDTPTLLEAQANTARQFLAEKTPSAAGADAQANTARHWLDEFDTTTVVSEEQRNVARNAFAAVTNPNMTDAEKKKAIAAMRVPETVRHHSLMLNEFDWEYVSQAKEIRGYVVAGLLTESKHPDAKIRLRALEMLGKLTEVGSFTERIEVKKIDATADELQERIRSKLATLLPKVVEVQDAVSRDATAQ